MKKVMHIIGPLGIGGAELLLLNTINSLKGYDQFLVYLNYSEFEKIEVKDTTIIKLDFNKKHDLPVVVWKLRKLIKEFKIDLVHTHLFWPTIIARLACPKNVRLFFTVHSILSEDAFKQNSLSLYLEKATYRSRHEAIFVSDMARQDYNKFVGLKGKNYVLHNFISDDFYKNNSISREIIHKPIRLVAVGKVKEAKNYPYLIRAFELLKNHEIFLDIYGGGELKTELEDMVNQAGLVNVILKGPVPNIPEVLTGYDIFVLSSAHEGFGLAAIEGMACGLPCFLSDIPVFREVTDGNAIFFDLKNEQDFVNKLLWAIENPEELKVLAKNGFKQAEKFNRVNYIQKLNEIYNAS